MSDSISTFFAKFMFILMFLGWLAGCSSIELQYPADRIEQELRQARLDHPEYTIQVVQYNSYEMQEHFGRDTCGHITKIPAANYCLINMLEHSSRTLRMNLNACFDDNFNGDNPPKVECG